MMTPAQARRIGKTVAMLGSPVDAEVVAAARAIERTLQSAGMGWTDFAAMVGSEVARQAAPVFTFRGMPARGARKAMAVLQRSPATTGIDRGRLNQMRARLLGQLKLTLSDEEIRWLDALWRAAGG